MTRKLWDMLDEINTIMWESFMIKNCPEPVKKEAIKKIMGVLDVWAEMDIPPINKPEAQEGNDE